MVDQTKILASFLPSGRLFRFNDSNLYKLLNGIAGEMSNCAGYLIDYLDHINPTNTEIYINEWEMTVGIPDDCFPATGSISERRSHVLAKLAALGVTSAGDFVNVAAIFGVTVTVSNGVDDLLPSFFTMTFPIELDEDIVTPDTFTMTFPFVLDNSIIDSDKNYEIVVTHTGPQLIVQCLFTKLKPANCTITYIEL